MTTALQQPFTPPAPWSPDAPYAGKFWYGSPALWTLLPADGTWAQLGRGEKVLWWRDGYYWRNEPEPALTVTGRRLDADVAEVRVARATNGYHPDLGSFMLMGLAVPAPGCWEVTGHYGEATLSFVVWVAP
jgi:hypothetical protein